MERKLTDGYKAIILDGVVLSKKTGTGAIKKLVPECFYRGIVLVALGIRHDMSKEVIDFYITQSESEAEWDRFLTNLYKRELKDKGVEVMCIDGGKGLLSALKTVYPDISVQRCWAHKPALKGFNSGMRNIINEKGHITPFLLIHNN